LADKWTANNSRGYDAEERKAGVEKFERFGSFNVLWALSGGDVTKMEDINKMQWAIIFLSYTYRNEIHTFERRYAEALSEKAERDAKRRK
jgi:hypothetical protein